MMAMVERNCPVCSAHSSTALFIKKGFQYVRCNACSAIYIDPIPTQEDISKVYDEYGKGYFTQEAKLQIDFSPGRYDRECGLLHRTCATGRVLDVGCATGSFLVAAQKAGFVEVEGLDIARPSVEFAQRQGLSVRVGDFTQAIFPAERFDVVTMWATLEHLASPRSFVREAYRVLSPGGLLAVSVPNWNSLTHLVIGNKDRYIGSDHLNYFDSKTLRRLLEDAGFVIARTETRGINPIVIWGDLRGKQSSVEQQIADGTQTLAVKTRPGYAPLRKVHHLVDRVLGRTGRGDLLLMAATKKQL
jgi:2-polyprenyl-3-methyl-5-hydroxy-6-metoxy-1,4-benzoquinol methylase